MKKTILITGASSGIGQASALYFAKKDWNVVATMRNPEKDTVLANQANIVLGKLDVENKQDIETALQSAIDKFGKIDVVLNNAGYGQQGIFEATTPEKIKKQFSVNLFGTMAVIRSVLPHFRKQKNGTIINVTSGLGRVTVPLVSIYAASKFALEGFTESLSFELAAQNIKVKIIEPGSIATNFAQTANANLAAADAIEDYKKYIEGMNEVFGTIRGNGSSTADDVAEVIFEAATDDTDQLRYVVGEDLKPLIQIRNNGTDEAYLEVLRKTFSPRN